VWNPLTLTQVGTLPVTTFNATTYPNIWNIAIDTVKGNFYVIGGQDYGSDSVANILSTDNLSTFTLANSLVFTQIPLASISNLVTWGTDGFAFIGGQPNALNQALYLVSSSALAKTSKFFSTTSSPSALKR